MKLQGKLTVWWLAPLFSSGRHNYKCSCGYNNKDFASIEKYHVPHLLPKLIMERL